MVNSQKYAAIIYPNGHLASTQISVINHVIPARAELQCIPLYKMIPFMEGTQIFMGKPKW